ncbi:hypothetical protein GALMADRAFT_1162048 [Galerina marginata CBS 339.88]|uniref:Uncharacterized protein n=1 Tax=Galerina marginata (strain CBS 339.88) TaxID=685588 RepID=A0A067S651_GALM3|nr:hypothetical protein GALMADRAFT_1162048 [Galerina marginata CBS 339.88]
MVSNLLTGWIDRQNGYLTVQPNKGVTGVLGGGHMPIYVRSWARSFILSTQPNFWPCYAHLAGNARSLFLVCFYFRRRRCSTSPPFPSRTLASSTWPKHRPAPLRVPLPSNGCGPEIEVHEGYSLRAIHKVRRENDPCCAANPHIPANPSAGQNVATS